MIQSAAYEIIKEDGRKEGLQEGLEKGLEKGLKQGEWNAKTKMVLNAKKIGLPMQTMIELSGLGEDEIMSILQESNRPVL